MRPLCILFAACLFGAVAGQTRNQNWLLAHDVWLDFSTDPPTNGMGAECYVGSTLCMSDTAGALLFYLVSNNGDTLRDASHGIMANSAGMDEVYSTAPGMALPMPGNPGRYVLVCLAPGLFHAGTMEVDMALNGGLGAVVDTVMDPFMSTVTTKVTAVAHGNGTDYWVILHEWMTDAFHAYRLSAAGLDPVPVVSHAGSVHWGTDPANRRYGPLVASMDGTRLALSAYRSTYSTTDNIVELFHFDPATGVVSYWTALPGLYHAVGVEFSPSGERLYVSDMEPIFTGTNSNLWQYTLSDPDSGAVAGSAVLLVQADSLFLHNSPSNTLLLAPTGKIYHRHDLDADHMGLIQDPDQAGLACNYDHQGHLGDPFRQPACLPNFCKRYHDSAYGVSVPEMPQVAELCAAPVPLNEQGWLLTAARLGGDALQWRDALGRTVRDETAIVNGNDILLQRGSLSPGTYVVALRSSGKVVGRARIVVL